MRMFAAALVAVLLAGCVVAEGETSQSPSPVVSPSAFVTAAPDEGVDVVRAPVVVGEVQISDTSPESLSALRAQPPQRLVVDALGIDMPVTDVGLEEDGSMEVPESAATAGWYRYGPAPGAERGSAVLAAHVDDAQIGLGPFSRLEGISTGERVSVTMEDGTELAYEVFDVERTSKQVVDMDLVFDRTGEATLVLVTCGGRFDWDTGHYEDNVVVYAKPVVDPAS